MDKDREIEIEKQLTKIEERGKSNTTRLDEHDIKIEKIDDKFDKVLNEMSTNIQLLTQSSTQTNNKMDKMEERLDKMNNDIIDIKIQPNKEKAGKWDKATWTVIACILTGITTFILGNLLGK